ncbi:TonB-dependent receptor [Cupriavidus basilensis]|uniref:Outer membrane receptor protein, mostly Fe transport n=1 Tax=Cupriavidus basilensis TaxID=68895 RepID=A0A0C4Y6D8_9BURK|nr:TonB-dependent receptor [Cupriavidus basilensis]AJG18503.1 Outer membrane receptor protein, mostly Fe transport [Cupriavidus basilensis]
MAPAFPCPRRSRLVPAPRRTAAACARLARLALAALAALAAGAPAGVAAQTPQAAPGDEVHNLREVTVVAPAPLPSFSIPREAFPGNAQTATDADMERAKAGNLSSFLGETMDSVVINDVQGNPFQKDMLYRGYRLSSTLGAAQGIALYLDGVRQNGALGDVVDWTAIPEAAISTITLVPGSNPLYGLNALGGALALTTKSGETHPGVEADLSLGGHGRARLDVSAGNVLGDGWHAFVAGTGFREDGWRQLSGSSLGNLFAKVGRSTTDTQWSVSVLGSGSSLSGNGLLPDSIDGSQRNAIYTAPDLTRTRSLQVTLNGTHQLNAEDQLALTAYARLGHAKASTGDVSDDYLDTLLGCQGNAGNAGCAPGAAPSSAVLNTASVNTHDYGLSGQWSHAGDVHNAVLGAAFALSRASYRQDTQPASFSDDRVAVADPGATPGTNASLDGRTSTVSLYASDTVKLLPHSYLTASARWNTSSTHTVLTLPNASDERFTFSKLNPSLGLSHRLRSGLTVFASASQGTRMPTAIELGCADPANACQLPTGLQADPYLRQVVSRTVEFGGRWKAADATELTLALYRSDNRDDILFQRSPVSPLGYFTNFPKTRSQGLELGLRQRLGPVMLRASYSYLQSTYQADGQIQTPFAAPVNVRPGTRMAGVPLHSFKLSGDWRATGSVTLGGTMIVSSSRAVAGNEDGALSAQDPRLARTAGFVLFNLRASWQVDARWQLYARVDNVFDRRYETYGQAGLNVFPGGTLLQPGAAVPIERFVAPGAPRLFLVGVRYEWGGR